MTVAAGQHFLLTKQNPVQFVGVGEFQLDVCVAAHAAILHKIGIPGGRVTLITGLAELSMRTDISKRRARLRIQWTRTEKTLPRVKHIPRNGEKCDYGGKDCRPCQTTRLIFNAHTCAGCSW